MLSRLSHHRSRRRAGERGETLIELLLAIAILGLVAGALLVGYQTTISATVTYRSLATIDTALRTAAEEATSYWQQNDNTAFSCPNNTSANISFDAIPAGYTATVTGVEYWSSGTFSTSCTALVPQLLTVQLTETKTGLTQSIGLVVNDPQAPPTPTAGPPTQLVFLDSGGPSDGTVGSPIPEQPEVAVEDSSGNVVTTDLSPIKLSIASGPNGSSLTGCSGNEFYGVVTFYGCEIDTIGTYTLQATSGSLTSAASVQFKIAAGPPAKMVFTTSPGNVTAGNPLSPQPVLTLQDSFGNVVTNDVSTATLAITPNTGNSNATLKGCTQQENSGVITFSGCEIDAAGTGYTLTATDGSVTATSTAFNVTAGTASQLVFTSSPGNSGVKAALSPQPVLTVEDRFGNPVTIDISTVTLTITTGTGASGAKLSGCTQKENAGVVTFSGCSIDTIGNGYTLTAKDASLPTVVSSAFNVAIGPATQLVWVNTPTGTQHFGTALSPQPSFQVEDAAGNVVTSDHSTVTFKASGTNVSGTVTGCTESETNGVITFTGCTVNRSGGGGGGGTTNATLTASATGLTPSPASETFKIGT